MKETVVDHGLLLITSCNGSDLTTLEQNRSVAAGRSAMVQNQHNTSSSDVKQIKFEINHDKLVKELQDHLAERRYYKFFLRFFANWLLFCDK